LAKIAIIIVIITSTPGSPTTCGSQCYDYNFQQFFTIFDEKIGVLLKNQCYDPFFQKLAVVLSKSANFFADFFAENIFKIITSVPGTAWAIYPQPTSVVLDDLQSWF
jgi:hypothetical protein